VVASIEGATLLGYDQGLPVVISPEAWQLGVYILGVTRMGKSTLLVDMMSQSIAARTPGLFIDPHRDTADQLLARLPEEDMERVVALDLLDKTHTFGLPLFACADPTDRLEIAASVERVLAIFELWGNLFETTFIEGFARNAVKALVVSPNTTLRDFRALLQPRQFRERWEELVAPLSAIDPDCHDFWRQYATLPPTRQDFISRPTFQRIDRFIGDPLIGDLVSQENPPFNLAKLLKAGKFVVAKLSVEHPQATKLAGALFVEQLIQAAKARVHIPEAERTSWHFYADEVGLFATQHFASLFTQTGKFGVYSVASHQDRSQVAQHEVVNKALLGAGTRIAFRVVRGDAQEIASSFDTYREGPPIQKIRTEPAVREWTETVWDPPDTPTQIEATLAREKVLEGQLAPMLNLVGWGGSKREGIMEYLLQEAVSENTPFFSPVFSPVNSYRFSPPFNTNGYLFHPELYPWYPGLPEPGHSYIFPASHPFELEACLTSFPDMRDTPLVAELLHYIGELKGKTAYFIGSADCIYYLKHQSRYPRYKQVIEPLPGFSDTRRETFDIDLEYKYVLPAKRTWWMPARNRQVTVRLFFKPKTIPQLHRVLRAHILPLLQELQSIPEMLENLRSKQGTVTRTEYLGYEVPIKRARTHSRGPRLYPSEHEDNLYVWEKGQPISPTVVAADIANQLERLDQFTCRVSFQRDGKKEDHTIARDKPEFPPQDAARQAMVEGIWNRSRQQYCLPRVPITAYEPVTKEEIMEEIEEFEPKPQPPPSPVQEDTPNLVRRPKLI
jgi:hypothetical protein